MATTPGSEGNAGGTPPVIAGDVATAVGPVFVANILNWMLMGTLIMQVYTYYRRFAKDRPWIRILVAVLFFLDIAHTGLLTAHGWFFTVEIWGVPDRLDEIPWSGEMIAFMCGLISCIVQHFYAWRIWVLSKNNYMRALAILISLISLMQGLSAMVGASILLAFNSDQRHLLILHPTFTIWLAGSFTTDIFITGCMTYILYNAKVDTTWKKSETLLTRMINNTVQTGAVTVVCACIDLVLFTRFVETNFHVVPAYILGKLYSNSLLLNLNLRRPQSEGASDTLPLHYFRSTGDILSGNQKSSRRTSVSEEVTRKRSVIGREGGRGIDPVKWDEMRSEPDMPTPVNIQIHTDTTTERSNPREDY